MRFSYVSPLGQRPVFQTMVSNPRDWYHILIWYPTNASPNLHMKIAFLKSFLYYLHMKLHIEKTHLLTALRSDAQIPLLLPLLSRKESK